MFFERTYLGNPNKRRLALSVSKWFAGELARFEEQNWNTGNAVSGQALEQKECSKQATNGGQLFEGLWLAGLCCMEAHGRPSLFHANGMTAIPTNQGGT